MMVDGSRLSETEPVVVGGDIIPDGVDDVSAYLEENGWLPFIRVGGFDTSVGQPYLHSWFHPSGEYLLEVGTSQMAAPFLRVADLLTLMDLLGRWVTIVETARFAELAEQLTLGMLDERGLVETVAARARWTGSQAVLEREHRSLAAMERDQAFQRRHQ